MVIVSCLSFHGNSVYGSAVLSGKKWVINNKEANVVSLGLAEQLQALRQMNWIEMEDSSCNTNAYYRLCFITGKPTLLLKPHNVMVPNYLLLAIIITTKDLASLEIISYAIFTPVICSILTCLFRMIQLQFACCSSILHIELETDFCLLMSPILDSHRPYRILLLQLLYSCWHAKLHINIYYPKARHLSLVR